MTGHGPLPHQAAELAWWGTAWLRGLVPTDDVLDHFAADEQVHLVADAANGTGGTLLDLLAALRRGGAGSVGLALPAHGDPLGLGGPPAFNAEALEHGQALVSDAGLGAVPVVGEETVVWHLGPAARRSVADVGEADRGLRDALRRATAELVRLDVARWRPEVADLLTDLHEGVAPEPVPGVPPRCLVLAERARVAAEIVALAMLDDGAAVSLREVGARGETLREVERAARRALVAACSPEVWPDPPRG